MKEASLTKTSIACFSPLWNLGGKKTKNEVMEIEGGATREVEGKRKGGWRGR
jgi:hypothetical protein